MIRCPVYLKLEWFNPFGSIKDRAAFYLLKGLAEREQLEDKQLVKPPGHARSEIDEEDFLADTSCEGAAHEYRCVHRTLEILQKGLQARGADATVLLGKHGTLDQLVVGSVPAMP